MPLIPDNVENINGLKVYDFNLLVHNPNKIELPSRARQRTVAVTVHNTENIIVASNTTPAEQYVRATLNGNMRDCRVNYYVDSVCAWRCLPDDWVNWSCADGCSNPNSGNNTSVAIEVIGDSEQVEKNCIKLIIYLLDKYDLTVETGLRTHSYWMNVRDGCTGSIDVLNVQKRRDKNCPAYILPHWDKFKDMVNSAFIDAYSKKKEQKVFYRVRKTWDDAKTQLGAYLSLENAKANCPEDYGVYNMNGELLYSGGQTKEKSELKINVYYKTFCRGKWLNEIVNYNDTTPMGYSGIVGKPINGLCAKVQQGQLNYRVHVKNGGWLAWINQYNENDWFLGCAGYKTLEIDGIQLELSELPDYDIRYRVSTGGEFYPWKIGSTDYAGVLGKSIDRIQMEVFHK